MEQPRKWATQQAALPPKTQRQVLPVLAHLRALHPNVLGQSLLSQNEVHARLVAAFEGLKSSVLRSGRDLAKVKLFVAVADLRNCYDSIHHDPLLRRVSDLPLSPRYRVTKVLAKRAMGMGGPGRAKRLLDVALRAEESLYQLVLSERCPAALRKEPLVIQPSSTETLRLSDVMATLKNAVQGCAATLATQRERTQFLVRGIPQGGRFSPFLCALHMGAGDAHLPPELRRDLGDEAFFFRLVDDFLYVCAGTEEPCCRFLTSLASKDNAFGGELNLRKCRANFPLRFSAEPEPHFEPRAKRRRLGPRSESGPSGPSGEVPWAGLSLQSEGGLLNIGPSKPVLHVRDTLAVARSRRANSGPTWQGVIRSKLMVFMDLKLQPLLVDPRLNSDACVLASVASVCRLCVQRFVWLLLRRSTHLGNVQPSFVTKQMLRLAWRAARRSTAMRASTLTN